MSYVTVPDVPLVKVGTWNGSTGPRSITEQDLADMVDAAASGELDKAVVKKGHLDPRHNNPTWDGEPAYGQVANLRLADNGQTLIGDMVNVPEDLATSMKSAYPNRSVEIAWNVRLKDATQKVRKQFRAALSGLALLGATPPAVKGLGGPRVAGLSAFSAGDYEIDTYSMAFEDEDALSGSDLMAAIEVALTEQLPGGAPVTHFTSDGTAFFTTAIGSYSVGFEVDGGIVRLSDEIEQLAKTPVVPHPGGNPDHPENTTSEEKEPTVAFNKQLREKLGLPESATDEEVLAKVGSASAFSEDGLTVTVSAAAFSELTESNAANATALAELQKNANAERRDGLIDAFAEAGKMHPTEAKYWRDQLDKNEADTVAFMEARTAIVPVHERGSVTAQPTSTGEFSDADFAAAASVFGLTTEGA